MWRQIYNYTSMKVTQALVVSTMVTSFKLNHVYHEKLVGFIKLWVNCLNKMRSSLFWDVTRRRLVIVYQCFKKPISPIFKSKAVQKQTNKIRGHNTNKVSKWLVCPMMMYPVLFFFMLLFQNGYRHRGPNKLLLYTSNISNSSLNLSNINEILNSTRQSVTWKWLKFNSLSRHQNTFNITRLNYIFIEEPIYDVSNKFHITDILYWYMSKVKIFNRQNINKSSNHLSLSISLWLRGKKMWAVQI
jgi:hypothetical protein